jgi:hypothetical protein
MKVCIYNACLQLSDAAIEDLADHFFALSGRLLPFPLCWHLCLFHCNRSFHYCGFANVCSHII